MKQKCSQGSGASGIQSFWEAAGQGSHLRHYCVNRLQRGGAGTGLTVDAEAQLHRPWRHPDARVHGKGLALFG